MSSDGFGIRELFYSISRKVLEITLYPPPQIAWGSETFWTSITILHWQPLLYLTPFLTCNYLPVTNCYIFFLQWKKKKKTHTHICSAMHEILFPFFNMKSL